MLAPEMKASNLFLLALPVLPLALAALACGGSNFDRATCLPAAASPSAR